MVQTSRYSVRAMIAILAPLALMQTIAAPAADPAIADGEAPVSLDRQAALRCSAAFALVANGQQQGNAAALAYPPLGERGKEFFVRTMAGLMDDAGLTRDEVSARVSREAQALSAGGTLDGAMPACLLLLDASGL